MELAHVTQVVDNKCRSHVSEASAEDSVNRVLVVSSAPEDQAALAKLLVSHSYPRYWASSVAEAADWLGRRSARVVICDDQLSDGGWQDLWDALRGRRFRLYSLSAHTWPMNGSGPRFLTWALMMSSPNPIVALRSPEFSIRRSGRLDLYG